MKELNMDKDQYNSELIVKAIEIAGGVQPLARKIGVSYQTILNWKKQRFFPSHINCMRIEQATEGKIKREDLLPNYPWESLR